MRWFKTREYHSPGCGLTLHWPCRPTDRPCWPALHRPCRPRGGVVTLTNPRAGHFFWKLALTRTPDPNWPTSRTFFLKTGTNPNSWPYLTHEMGIFWQLALTRTPGPIWPTRQAFFKKVFDKDPVGWPTGPMWCLPTPPSPYSIVVVAVCVCR